MLASCGAIVILPNFGKFRAMWKPDSGRLVCKTYILIKNDLLHLDVN